MATALASAHDGVVHRRDLRAAGISRHDVRTEVAAGRWQLAGRHTVVVTGPAPLGRGLAWRAVWEAGAGAMLDGVAALVAHGLTGFTPDVLDVAIPANNRRHRVPGVRLRPRHSLGPRIETGLPRARPEYASIRAAQWAASDRMAALLICLPVQLRLVSPDRLAEVWAGVQRSPRRRLLDLVVADVCDGAHSLGELDFARVCRQYRLPTPTRQAVRRGRAGAVYLDAAWEDPRRGHTLAVEIDGSHHYEGLNTIADALRQNELAIGATKVLRIPLLGLRLDGDAFMRQVARALHGNAAGQRPFG